MLLRSLNLSLIFFGVSSVLLAQKPMPVSPLEIRLPAENTAWTVEGNARIATSTGYPEAIYQPNFALTPGEPETMARQYLMLHRSLLGLSNADLDNLKLHAVRQDATGTTVRLRQLWKGLPVNKNAEITVHIGPSNLVDFVMNGWKYGVSLSNVTPQISASTARQTVVNHLGITGDISDDFSNLMVFRHAAKDYLVYRINLVTSEPLGDWEALVDAHDGTLLQVIDAGVYHHHEPTTVSVPPAESPFSVLATGTGNTFDPDPLTTALAAYGGSYVDGTDANAAVLTAQLKSRTLLDITLSAGTYSLVGTYAEIQDFEGPNKGLFSQASPTFAFDRSADAFEAVNTYFHIDASMRYINTVLGLTILPYQYAGGVRFDPSGLNGADNSHYVSGSGRLAFGEGGVDDAEDADVIIHELGHGLHDWVTAGGLSQVNGLSEGSGDYWAASYSRAKGYWSSGDPAYNWTFNWDGHNPFWGGRITNYTAVYPTGLVGAIHTDGQIWATAMMKIWNDIGSAKSDKIFWSGLGMTNSSTSQNDAANAVYQAAITLGYTYTERQAVHTRFTAAGYTLPALPPLPLELTAFGVRKVARTAMLDWTTSTESGTAFFNVERSANGRDFSVIGKQEAAGNSSTERRYTFTDAAPLGGENFYRLQAFDKDGTSTYSPVQVLDFGTRQTLVATPNPTHNFLTVNAEGAVGVLNLYDALGRLVLSKSFENADKNTSFTLDLTALPRGVYSLRLEADGQVSTTKVIKN